MPTLEQRAIYPNFADTSVWQSHTPESIVSETTTVGVEKTQKERNLREEMGYLALNWKKEGLPQNWIDLPGTGFLVQTQMDNLRKTMRGADTPSARKEKLGVWVRQTEADLKGFQLEYLNERLVFPLSYDIKERGGRKRVINTFHGGNLLLEESVSKNERNGATHDVLVNEFEPFFLSAPEGSLGVMVSPAGDSGMRDDQGKKIEFPDSLVFIWQKRGESITGFGIKTDFTHAEQREFLKRLTGKDLPKDAPAEQYVRTAALFSSFEADIHGMYEPKDIIDVMRDTRFEKTGGSLYAYKNTMWKDVYKDMQRGEDLWTMDDKTQALITEFIDFANEESWDEYTLKQALSVTVLRMSKLLRGEMVLQKQSKGGILYAPSFGSVFDDLRTIPGCAGGGSGTRTSAVDSIIKRLTHTIGNEPKEKGCSNCQTSVCGVCEVHASSVEVE